MAGDPPKLAIPAWQRVKPSPQQDSSTPPQPDPSSAEAPVQSPPDEVDASEETAPDGPDSSIATQLDQVDALLQDPSIQAAPVDAKRAFLERKSIPVETIDTYLSSTTTSAKESTSTTPFIASQPTADAPQTHAAPTPRTIPSGGPPIITYPEFLVDAHHSPPLITPQRVLGAAYLAGGITALIYGANQFLVTPMLEALTASRHDFATHNLSRLDELNERLSGMVSKIPDKYHSPRGAAGHETRNASGDDDDDDNSETSQREPTELFSRDFGTQTSPPPSRRPSLSIGATPPRVDATDAHVESLAKAAKLLAQMRSEEEDASTREKEQQASVSKLQNYLDTMIYASPNISPAMALWSANEDAGTNKATNARDDTVDQLKKEIRGVKGLLLSARRFPSTAAGRALS